MAQDILFNVAEAAQAKGYQLVGTNDDGSLIAKDSQGNSGRFDPLEFTKTEALREGIDPARVKIEINSPATAIPESPASWADRFRLGAGNQEGRVDFLKKKFQGVEIHKDNGIVVNDKGVWKQIDPDFLKGDGWTISEGLKDLADGAGGYLPQIVGQMLGAKVGQTVGGVVGGLGMGAIAGPEAAPAGAFAGALSGGATGAGAGAALGNDLRIRMGKAFGTYKDTDQGHLDDNAVEALAAMVSEPLSLGTRPTWNWFKGMMGKFSRTASEAAKDTTASVLGATTSAGPEATRIMMDQTPEVGKVLTQLKATGARTPDQIAQAAAERQVKAGTDLLEKATDALPARYGQFLNNLFTKAEARGLKVVPGEIAVAAQDDLAKAGYGKVVSVPGGGRKLVQYSTQELAERRAAGIAVPAMATDTAAFGKFATLFNELETFSKIPALKGEAAAKAMTEMNKSLNAVSKEFYKTNAGDAASRAVAQAQSTIRNRIGSVFEEAGLRNEYSQGSKLYDKYKDAVTNVQQLLDKGKGIQPFVDKYIKSAMVSGKNLYTRGEVKILTDLVGKDGEALTQDIIHTEAAKRFAPIATKLTTAASVGGAAYMGGYHKLGLGITAAALPATSPRAVMAGTQAAKMAIGFTSPAAKQIGAYGDVFISTLLSAPPAIQNQILRDPEAKALKSAFHIIGSAAQEEEKQKAAMLNQAGVGQ
jgi:hypothetical protein